MIDHAGRIRLLLGLNAILAAMIVVGVLVSPGSSSRRANAYDLLKRAEAVRSIRIAGTETVDLARSGETWSLSSADGPLPADPGRVKSFLEAVDSVAGLEMVARNKDAWAKLGLEGDSARHVILNDADGVRLAEFTLGTYAESAGEVHLSLPDGTAAYVAPAGMASYIMGKRTSWLDLRAWSTPPATGQVQELVVTGEVALKDGVVSSYRATRSKGGWVSDGVTLDSAKVEAVIRAVANLKGNDYASKQEPAGKKAATVELVLGNGTKLGLVLEDAKGDGSYPALSSQRERRLYLPAWSVEGAFRPLSSLLQSVQVR
jgi:hypothetical protein